MHRASTQGQYAMSCRRSHVRCPPGTVRAGTLLLRRGKGPVVKWWVTTVSEPRPTPGITRWLASVPILSRVRFVKSVGPGRRDEYRPLFAQMGCDTVGRG